jgi:hypothetical protein
VPSAGFRARAILSALRKCHLERELEGGIVGCSLRLLHVGYYGADQEADCKSRIADWQHPRSRLLALSRL